MKCGSNQCDRLAVARWAAVMADHRATPTSVQVTFLLCAEHDEWYQSMERQYSGFRIGLLADEACQHSPSQREAARRYGAQRFTLSPEGEGV